MENEKIINVYEFEMPNQKNSYMYSMKNNKDISYTYYVLTENKENQMTNYEIGNTLDVLQKNNIKLIPIKNNKERYEQFLEKFNKIQEEYAEFSKKTKV